MSSLQYPIEVPKYCVVCQKGPFSSVRNAQAHFNSTQHKEAEISKQLSNNRQFFCKVCSEKCNGPKSFMEHMASPRHKVRQEKSQQFQRSSETKETHNRPYDFDGKRGYCYICDVDLTSKENASQHLNGDKHRKKLQQSQSCQQSNKNCNACRITFPDDGSAEHHFISVHQKSRSDQHTSLNMSMNLRESFGASLIPEEKPQSDDELDKLFQNFQVDLQNETPPQSVLENLQRHSRPFDKNSNRNTDAEYTFSISRGFCNVCQVDLTSVKHRDQHLSGVKHNKAMQSWLAKRKGNVQNVSKIKEDPIQPMEEPVVSGSSLLEEVEYIFEGGRGFCNVCKLELSSIEHASEHLNSAKHKTAKEDWIKDDVSLSINQRNVDKMEDSIIKPHPFLQTSCITQKSPTVTTTSTVSNSPLFPLPSTPTPDKPDYVFTGNRGYCNICSLELSSKQHADQHLNGAKHQKAKAVANVPLSPNNPIASQSQMRNTDIDYTFEGSRGFCCICNLELTSKQHAHQHLSGAKHNKAKNATQGLAPNLGNVSEMQGRIERADPERGNQEYTFNGSKGYCNVCKLELTSKSHAENHLHGKPHNKARQRWMQGYRENVALYCEVCRIPCSGPESMQQHLASKKHKERVEAMSGEVADSPVAVPIVTSDNTKWFPCDICNCKLNSQQQLEAHQQSPKHRAQEEKLLRQGRSAVTPQNVYPTHEGINPTYRQAEQNYDYTGYQMQGILNDFQRRNIYEGRFLNNNAGPSENQFNQYTGNYLQMSPNVDNVNMPSYVKPLVSDRSPLPNEITPNIVLPQPSVKEPKVNFAPPSNEIEYFPPFDSLNVSLGSALTLGSLRHNTSSFKIEDGRIMVEMARPNVFRTDSIENDMAVEIGHGVNSYRNLNFEQTNLKSNIPMIDNLMIQTRRNNVDIDTAESVDRENISESPAFKSAIDEKIASKLNYHHRGHPDGGDSDDEDTNNSSDSCYNKKSSFKSKQCDKEIIVPEITTDVLPMYGDSHFKVPVDDPAEFTSSSDNSSHSRKPSNTDMSRAIKNRYKSKASQVSLSSQTDSSVESSESPPQISLGSQTDTSVESSSSEKFDSGVIKNVFHDDCNNKNNNANESLEVEDNLSDTSIKSPGTSLENPRSLMTSQIAGTSGRNPDRNSPYLYFCQTCKRPMNTEKSYREHMHGQRHLDKVAVESAPDREHPPIKSFNDYGRIGFNLTNTKPRSYQIELFSKTLECDRVCFLPTGTGKTLISCMTISAMLKQNPTKQVMFLVDKVLLVLQQSQYIKKEIGDREYGRFSHEDPSKLEKRNPLIAALCGGSQNTGGIPLWKHDVIVVTAACYSNLLLKKILRWEDNCLIVFDEAHHCIKNHPFNQLLQGYQCKYPQNVRPKLLGLTASPAGQSSVDETILMLHQLIDNLGGAMIALVEENTYELRKFQSNATIEIHYTTMTRKEKSFKEELQIYLLNCYTRLCEETDLLQQFDLGLRAKKHLTAEELLECAKEVDGSLLNSLEITINMASPKEDSKSDRKIFSRNLIKHTQYICIALNVLIESGVQMAIEELQELMASDPSTSFEFADMNGLPSARMKDALQTCMNVERSNVSLHSHDIDASPQLSKLIEIVTRTDYVNWSDKGVMVLVLVKQRETAFKIKNMLNSHDAIEKLQLNVEAVVGHGSTSGTEQGMSVAQQKQILENMRKKLYHIVVATAVAEEGIDIPECELVITFNPPSTVTALVQMRGRARKNHSKFIILCNSSKEIVELEDLMKKEKNMIEAAEQMIKKQKMKKI